MRFELQIQIRSFVYLIQLQNKSSLAMGVTKGKNIARQQRDFFEENLLNVNVVGANRSSCFSILMAPGPNYIRTLFLLSDKADLPQTPIGISWIE